VKIKLLFEALFYQKLEELHEMATYPPNKKLLLDLIIESVEPLLSHC
jgi:hypothetical protein